MLYRITEIKTRHDRGHDGHTYMIVEYLTDGGVFVLRNDFCRLMPLTKAVVPRDGDGNPELMDGSFADMAALRQTLEDAVAAAIDPSTDPAVRRAWDAINTLDFKREDTAVNFRDQLMDAIQGYWRMASQANWTGDHTMDGTQPFFKDGVFVSQTGATLPPRDDVDARGVATDADVMSMVGESRDLP